MVRGCLKLRINLSSAVSLIMNSIISFISFFLGGGGRLQEASQSPGTKANCHYHMKDALSYLVCRLTSCRIEYSRF